MLELHHGFYQGIEGEIVAAGRPEILFKYQGRYETGGTIVKYAFLRHFQDIGVDVGTGFRRSDHLHLYGLQRVRLTGRRGFHQCGFHRHGIGRHRQYRFLVLLGRSEYASLLQPYLPRRTAGMTMLRWAWVRIWALIG